MKKFVKSDFSGDKVRAFIERKYFDRITGDVDNLLSKYQKELGIVYGDTVFTSDDAVNNIIDILADQYVNNGTFVESLNLRNSVNLNKIFSNDSGRKPVMSKITQRELRDMAENGQATDITRWDVQEIENLGSLEIIQVSKGTYGMNGALFKGEDGKLYVITARNTNLFRFV